MPGLIWSRMPRFLPSWPPQISALATRCRHDRSSFVELLAVLVGVFAADIAGNEAVDEYRYRFPVARHPREHRGEVLVELCRHGLGVAAACRRACWKRLVPMTVTISAEPRPQFMNRWL